MICECGHDVEEHEYEGGGPKECTVCSCILFDPAEG
jgi:hypothetical protein